MNLDRRTLLIGGGVGIGLVVGYALWPRRLPSDLPLRAAAFPTGAHMRIYRRMQFGSLIDLSVLDTRQWRSDQACNDGTKTCPASLDPASPTTGPSSLERRAL